MKKRTIETKEQLAVLVAETAAYTVNANILRASLDSRILAAHAAIDPELDATNKAIKSNIAVAKAWALKHKSEFGPGKSMDFGLGTVGFRTGMPKVSLLKGWTVENVIESIRRLFPRRGYVRTVDVLDNAALIAARDELTPADQAAIGVDIGQDEKFFVDIDIERASARHSEKVR